MKMIKLFISLYLVCLVFSKFYTTLNGIKFEYVLDFKKMCRSQNGTFAFLYGISIAECIGECGVRQKCAALNYKRRIHKCELFPSVTEGEEKIGDCIYTPSSDIKVIPNPCSECEYGKTCDKISHLCKYIDCGTPSVLPFGTVYANMTTHGAEAVYTCHFGYDLRGDDFKRTCVQGTWNGTKPTCSPIPNVACYVESFQYKGIRNSTINGILCQRWDSQNPHKHFRNNVSTFPEETLQEAENYCRDPDGEGTPWCYTIDPNKRWDICKVEKC